jgi:hypothetical protein
VRLRTLMPMASGRVLAGLRGFGRVDEQALCARFGVRLGKGEQDMGAAVGSTWLAARL